MVGFATFFLGIVSGLSIVGVVPGENVACVELYLDETHVASLTKPPWETPVDLGRYPEPHLLVAVARDARDHETGRAEQWINWSGRNAEASLVLRPGSGGRGRTAALAWRSVVAADPIAVRLTFDGRPLAAVDPSHVPLPDFVPEQVHFLRAELDFEERISASAEIVFGGRQKDQAETQLTAVLVNLPRGRKLPPPEAMDGWFLAGRRPLRVVATEEGPSELLAVVDTSARPVLERMAAGRASMLRYFGRLRREERLRLVWPFPRLRSHSGFDYLIYPESEELTSAEEGGFLSFYSRLQRPALPVEDQRLRDALAVAALSASGRNRRRAVILLAGEKPLDRSDLPLEGLSHFLESISVPIFVVSVDKEGHGTPFAFGTPLEGGSLGALSDAFAAVSAAVERQRVVWVAGKHLPQRIELSPLARGLSRVP